LNKAGIPIVTAVTRLAETTRHKYFLTVLTEIIELLNAGRSFSYALKQFPKVFSRLFVNIVAVGENTGRLDEVFLQLGDYLKLEGETRKRIKAALRYPLIVISTTLIAILIINAFVVPVFAKMFASFKGELPIATRILMTVSNIITGYWYAILFGLVVVVVAWFQFLKADKGRLFWDRSQLKLPFVGWIIHRTLLSRFARLYSLILKSGISALDGMDMVATSMGNAHLESRIKEMAQGVARGVRISRTAQQAEMFSPLVIQMLTLGEETGHIDDMLLDVAEFYEREVSYDLGRLSDAVEPILLIVMAVMVFILAIGVFLPMWDMIGMARR